ncbi:Cation-transporting P family ATPase [Listeria monocytogenes]|uniref:Heavy metal transporter n=1 Tax=Geosporobacter ferrireducens TaxID=1424294 RepID=A0A1D8GN02_9FIRM|nr:MULTISPECIES: cation transporter [Clostridia]EAE7887218.1 heavy metal transporter [Listeria monocytogenes]EIR6828281.1 cation transporter [Listeria innocua]MCC7571718.1 cation transporter [Candidatus Micrarchaeota archaeon]HQF36808.1 cation transporter [Candidatus Dojkabacteria bacterium]AOT72288.1 heavy metal transporter [Geosporobacter ferrireducens]
MKKKFILEGLDCADCAAKIEHAVNKLDGVKEATVNFMTQKLVIEGEDEKMPTIMQEAEKIVKKIEPGTVMKKA